MSMGGRLIKLLITGVVGTLLFIAANLAFAQLPPAKQIIQQQYDQERTAGAQHPAPRDPNATGPIVTEGPYRVGIIKPCDAPISSENAHIVSCWQDILNGLKTKVFTGAQSAQLGDSQQGVIYVMTVPDYPRETSVVTFLTPIKAGAVRIVKAKGDLLTLVSATGCNTWTFRVSTKQLIPRSSDKDDCKEHDDD